MSNVLPVHVTIRTSDRVMHTRKYVPSAGFSSQQEFSEFALGNLIALVTSGHTDTLDLDDTSFLGASFGDVSLTTTAGHVVPFDPPIIQRTHIVTGWAVEIIRA